MDITFGIAPLATQFITYSIQIYQLFEASKNVGHDFSRSATGFRVQMTWLSTWARQQGLVSQQSINLDPQEERYLLALQVLAVIASILADMNSLGTKFRESASGPRLQRGGLRLSVPEIFQSSSRSPSRTRSHPSSPGSGPYLQELDKLGLRESASINEQLDVLGKYASKIQKSLLMSSKLGRAFSDKGKLEVLAVQLRRWNEHLKRLDLPLKPETNTNLKYRGSLDLDELLPGGHFGHVMITTRKKEVARKYEAICVAEFGKEVGVELLVKSSKKHQLSEIEMSHAINIVELIGRLPLALDQAGAYVFTADYSFAEYEKLLRTKYSEHMFGDKGPQGNMVFATTSHIINTVWRLSFDTLPEDAAKLLMLCSFIGNGEIQREMLYRGRKEVNWMISEQTIDGALKDLLSFSLIKREESKNLGDYSILVHPVVHKWVRSHVTEIQRLQSREGAKGGSRLEREYSELALHLVTSTFVLDGPRSSKEWTYELSIVPHIKCCFEAFKNHTIAENEPQYRKVQAALYSLARMYTRLGFVDEAHDAYVKVLSDLKKESFDSENLKIMDHFGKNLSLQGKYVEALKWYRRALAGKEKAFGKDDFSALETRGYIAKTLLEHGLYEQALWGYKEVLELQEKNLGDFDPSTLETRQNLAAAHKDLGNYAEALSLLKEVRSAKEKIIADQNDPSMLDTIHVMGLVLEAQGKYTEAQLEYERVFVGREKSLGRDHYSTLIVVHSIAGLHARKELYEEALSLYGRVLSGLTDRFGRDHPWTLMAISGIADVFDTKGRYDEALKNYEEVYGGFRKRQMDVRGGYMAANDIGKVMNKKGQYEEALKWHRRAEEGGRRELGEDHVTTLSSKFGIACTLENQGKYNQALSMYWQVHEGMSKALGADHNTTWTVTCSIASALSGQGQYQDALDYYRQAEQGHKKAVGEDHQSTLEAVHGMANALDNLARYDEAMTLYKRAYDRLGQKLGKDHASTLLVAYRIGAVFEHQKKFDAALERYEYAEVGLTKKLGENHPWTLLALHGMGNISANRGRYSDSLDYYQRVLDGRLSVLGDEHPLTFEAMGSIASISNKEGRYSEALDLYQQALVGLEKAVGSDHPLTLTVMHGKAGVFKKQKKYAEALALYGETRDRREKILGKLHPETILSKEKELSTKRQSFFSKSRTK